MARCEEDDLQRCLEISKEAFGATDKCLLEAISLNNLKTIYVAKINNVIAGCGIYQCLENEQLDDRVREYIKDDVIFNIASIAISSEFRGQQLGNRMVEKFCRIAECRKLSTLMEVMNYCGTQPAKTKNIADTLEFEYMGYIPNRWKSFDNGTEYCIYCKSYDCDCGSLVFKRT